MSRVTVELPSPEFVRPCDREAKDWNIKRGLFTILTCAWEQGTYEVAVPTQSAGRFQGLFT